MMRVSSSDIMAGMVVWQVPFETLQVARQPLNVIGGDTLDSARNTDKPSRPKS